MFVEDLLESSEEPIGGRDEPAHPLDRLGDHGGHVTGGGDVEHVPQVVDTGCDELVVGEVAEGAAQLVAPVDVGDGQG